MPVMVLNDRGWNTVELDERYYLWLVGLVSSKWQNYTLLLRRLYDTPFRVTLLMDENRVGDGLNMRDQFAYQGGLDIYDRDALKRCRPCSVLEVMVALAQRFEQEYMTNYDDEDPIGVWFGPMVSSLGLTGYDDQHFDPYGFDRIMKTFLDREYSPNGRGSLFYIPDTDQDMRHIEIWHQMMLWNGGRK